MGSIIKDKYLEDWLKFISISEMVVFIFVFGMSTKLINYWYSRRHLRELARRLPGSRSLPIIGDAPAFYGNARDSFSTLLKYVDRYGSPCRIWIGSKLYVVLTDPDDIALILGNNNILARDANICKVAEPLMGEGIITSKDDIWRIHRKIIAPTFGGIGMQHFIEEFNVKTRTLVERLTAEADGATFNIYPFISSCTLDIICSTSMGTSVNTYRGGLTYIENLERGIRIVEERFLKPWLFIEWIYRLTNLYRDQCIVLKHMNKFTDKVIGERINARNRNQINEFGEYGQRKIVLLDRLISASENEGVRFTSKELRDEVNTIISAGHETSGTSISYALLLLGMYPKVQEKVINEQRQIFGTDFYRAVTHEDIQQMTYLDRVIRETLRMFPPAPLINREIEEDVKIKDYTLPAGCSVIIINYKTHRLAEHFPEPDLFNPDRFLVENTKGRHPYAYIPFGSGPRNCVGRSYAILQMKTMLSTLLRYFKVSSRLGWEDLDKLDCSIVLKPATGYNIELLPRKDGTTVDPRRTAGD